MVGGDGSRGSGDERLHRRVGLGHHGRGERGGGAVLGRDHGLEEHGEVALVGGRRVPVGGRRRRGIIRPVRDDAVAFLAVYACTIFLSLQSPRPLRSCRRYDRSSFWTRRRVKRVRLWSNHAWQAPGALAFLLWEQVG